MILTLSAAAAWMLLPAVLIVVVQVVQILNFNKTTYHKATGNSYFETISDKGKNGEYRTYEHLKYLEKQGARFLFNLYLPEEDGGTTESDVILLTSGGFIIFESKNYSGWIFGDDKSKMWTQTLPQGRGRPARREKFFNPVFQNNLHIKALKALIGDTYPVYSIIVFSERCELKRVSVSAPNIKVVKRTHLADAVREAIHTMPQGTISSEEMDRLYEKLYPYSQVSEEVKQRHIQAIRRKY